MLGLHNIPSKDASYFFTLFASYKDNDKLVLDYLIKSQIRNTKYFGQCLEQCDKKKTTFWGKADTTVNANLQGRIFYKTIMEHMNPLNKISMNKFINELNDSKTLTDINNNYSELNQKFHNEYAASNKPATFTQETQKSMYSKIAASKKYESLKLSSDALNGVFGVSSHVSTPGHTSRVYDSDSETSNRSENSNDSETSNHCENRNDENACNATDNDINMDHNDEKIEIDTPQIRELLQALTDPTIKIFGYDSDFDESPAMRLLWKLHHCEFNVWEQEFTNKKHKLTIGGPRPILTDILTHLNDQDQLEYKTKYNLVLISEIITWLSCTILETMPPINPKYEWVSSTVWKSYAMNCEVYCQTKLGWNATTWVDRMNKNKRDSIKIMNEIIMNHPFFDEMRKHYHKSELKQWYEAIDQFYGQLGYRIANNYLKTGSKQDLDSTNEDDWKDCFPRTKSILVVGHKLWSHVTRFLDKLVKSECHLVIIV